MKRWIAIRMRRWGGKYTYADAEAWEDWTRQWQVHREHDVPIVDDLFPKR